ncbi:hypothetical protein LTR56_016187 [Elasticomyces elasticus]|nr:hypothetical protein LTR56_016187 [Elasticomyces elasticus]KAK3642146.1 hypothetical protein LTR22_016267 [Elasticomyces elasticus]KAK4914194.1 hypothetical protein LTR49_017547 [Elasticomyces elasticus]KAK5762555.1 hypothetical protein LTS12_007346 [Elasticomyces elasticus]
MAAKTFGIAELLETILLRLPTKDLLLSQRVCKTWKAACTSTKIRKALFLEPGTEDDVAPPEPCGFTSGEHCTKTTEFVQGLQRRYACVVNPLFIQHICLWSAKLNGKRISRASKHERYREMSLTQPPTALNLAVYYTSSSNCAYQPFTGGITIRETVRTCDELLRGRGGGETGRIWYLE